MRDVFAAQRAAFMAKLPVSIENLPFGGFGLSEMGTYHGVGGLRTLSHVKAAFKQSRFNVAKLAGLKPRYGAALQRWARQ